MMGSQSQVEYELISAITDGCIMEPHTKLSMAVVYCYSFVVGLKSE